MQTASFLSAGDAMMPARPAQTLEMQHAPTDTRDKQASSPRGKDYVDQDNGDRDVQIAVVDGRSLHNPPTCCIKSTRRKAFALTVVVVLALCAPVLACLSELPSLSASRISILKIALSPDKNSEHSVLINASTALDYPARLLVAGVHDARCNLSVGDAADKVAARMVVQLEHPLTTAHLTEVALRVIAPNILATFRSSWAMTRASCAAVGKLHLLHALTVPAHIHLSLSNANVVVSVRVAGIRVWRDAFDVQSRRLVANITPANYRGLVITKTGYTEDGDFALHTTYPFGWHSPHALVPLSELNLTGPRPFGFAWPLEAMTSFPQGAPSDAMRRQTRELRSLESSCSSRAPPSESPVLALNPLYSPSVPIPAPLKAHQSREAICSTRDMH